MFLLLLQKLKITLLTSVNYSLGPSCQHWFLLYRAVFLAEIIPIIIIYVILAVFFVRSSRFVYIWKTNWTLYLNATLLCTTNFCIFVVATEIDNHTNVADSFLLGLRVCTNCQRYYHTYIYCRSYSRHHCLFHFSSVFYSKLKFRKK